MDGYRLNVVTGETYIIPKEEWKKRIRRAIIIEREDWDIIQKMIYGPCIKFACKQQLDLISGSFEALDDALGKLPGG